MRYCCHGHRITENWEAFLSISRVNLTSGDCTDCWKYDQVTHRCALFVDTWSFFNSPCEDRVLSMPQNNSGAAPDDNYRLQRTSSASCRCGSRRATAHLHPVEKGSGLPKTYFTYIILELFLCLIRSQRRTRSREIELVHSFLLQMKRQRTRTSAPTPSTYCSMIFLSPADMDNH